MDYCNRCYYSRLNYKIAPIKRWAKNVMVILKEKEFVSEYADEKITVEFKLRSQDFDVVKIHATTHTLGVRAEKEWLNKFYPGYENNMQMLDQITAGDGKILTFDILPIYKDYKKKTYTLTSLIFIVELK